MNIHEFPKSKEKLKVFMRKNLESFQKNIAKEAAGTEIETPKIEDSMVESYMEAMLITQPRILYDFFDSNDIIITIDMFQGKFKAGIVATLYKSKEFDSRVEMENTVFEDAFKILEKI